MWKLKTENDSQGNTLTFHGGIKPSEANVKKMFEEIKKYRNFTLLRGYIVNASSVPELNIIVAKFREAKAVGNTYR